MLLFWTDRSSKKAIPEQNESKEETELNITGIDSVSDNTTEITATETFIAADSSSIFNAMNGNDGVVTLDNGKVRIDISNKGGVPASAKLYGYKEQDGTDILLFGKDDISLSFMIDGKNENINTKDLYFQPVDKSDSSVTMRLAVNGYGWLDFIYTLHPESYLLDFEIKANGMYNFFSSDLNTISMDWIQNLRQHEKGFEFEQRYTTLTYKTAEKRRAKIIRSGKGKIQ